MQWILESSFLLLLTKSISFLINTRLVFTAFVLFVSLRQNLKMWSTQFCPISATECGYHVCTLPHLPWVLVLQKFFVISLTDHISTHSWNHHFLGPWRLNKWESTVCVLTPVHICLTSGELLHELVECIQVFEFLLVCTHLRAKENKASIWFITVIKSIVELQSFLSLKQVVLKNCVL